MRAYIAEFVNKWNPEITIKIPVHTNSRTYACVEATDTLSAWVKNEKDWDFYSLMEKKGD